VSSPRLSIVIPSWNTVGLLRECLRTIEQGNKPRTEVIVIDNGSEDNSAEMVAAEFPAVRLTRNAVNEGFAKGSNAGIRQAKGEYVLLHNADTEVHQDALDLMVNFLDGNPEYGAAAPKLVNQDGSTQGGCMAFPGLLTPLFFGTPLERWAPNSRELKRYFLRDWNHEADRDIEQPPAACLMIRRSVLDEIGHFDEALWLFFNDVDLSLRLAKAGHKTRFVAAAKVMHHVGASTSQFRGMHIEWQKNRLHYYRKHHGRLSGPWVKLCVTWTFLDYAMGQVWSGWRGRGRGAIEPYRKAWSEFIRL
jgi:N-acetylglucosaminyl-diphospho-decaprenol L-rhamnosyltransferase